MNELAQLGAQIAGVAAGAAGIGYLARKGWIGGRLLARAGKATIRLAKLGDEDTWPNGSRDLPSFLARLYGYVESIDTKLDRHLIDHQAAEYDRARGTGRWDPPDGTAV